MNFQDIHLKKEAFKNEVCKKCLKNSSNV